MLFYTKIKLMHTLVNINCNDYVIVLRKVCSSRGRKSANVNESVSMLINF